MKASYSKDGERNQHRLDEMPKNRPSRYVTTRCGSVAWFQEPGKEPGTVGGHKVKHQGHRMVSGIVRQKTKEEVRQTIRDSV